MVVRTVTGDCEAAELGVTSMHEHLFIDATVWLEDPARTPTTSNVDQEAPVSIDLLHVLRRNPRILRDNLVIDDEELVVSEVAEFASRGGGCIVDTTTIGLGRDVEALSRVSQRTGVRVVAGTGFYVERSCADIVDSLTIEQLTALMIADIVEGVDGTTVKAGIIGEIGTSILTEREVKVLRACAFAQQATGAAISLHTEFGCREGDKIVALLAKEGVKPDRVIVGHLDENLVEDRPVPSLSHLDYHRRVGDTGAWIQYDTFGQEWSYDSDGCREPHDEERIAGIAELASAGYGGQILLGQDVWLKQCLKHYGGPGFDHLLRVVPNLLGRAGVGEDLIRKFLVDNPARALTLAS